MFNSSQCPVVSIVIPTYNQAAFLKQALESVIKQTLTDWEAIVINNYSVDETEEVVDSFRDNRIRLLNFRNQGIIAASRNLGIHESKAEFVAFLDSDDIWFPDKLMLSVDKVKSGFDVVCHAEEWHYADRVRRVAYGPERAATYNSLLYEGNCLSTSAVLARKDSLQKVSCFSEETEFVTAEDYDLWLKLASSGARIGFIDEVLGIYRLHDNNESRNAIRNMNAISKVVERHFELMGPLNIRILLNKRRRYSRIFYGTARTFQESGEYMKAWPWFFRGLYLWPFSPRLLFAMGANLVKKRLR
jgi:glycosyltransferase involved in cell wall biosynthesis